MIENIELYQEDKTRLKHLSIDKGTPLSEWMLKGAYYVLENNPEIPNTPVGDYATFTMNISSELKKEIRTYIVDKDVKIRDFWIKVASLILENEGCFDA